MANVDDEFSPGYDGPGTGSGAPSAPRLAGQATGCEGAIRVVEHLLAVEEKTEVPNE